MIDEIKNEIWGSLKEMSVSLDMIYDSQGNILWNKGRRITCKSIHDEGG